MASNEIMAHLVLPCVTLETKLICFTIKHVPTANVLEGSMGLYDLVCAKSQVLLVNELSPFSKVNMFSYNLYYNHNH